MPDLISIILFSAGLFILELAYFKIAFAYKIIDKPNRRSSHQKFTIRGGGVVFPLAVLIWWSINGFNNPWFIAGLVVVSIVSFIDDLNHLDSKIRFFFQFLALALVLIQLDMSLQWYLYLMILFLAIGTKNAWNFMDGINGITGSYSLVTIASLFYINQYINPFSEGQLMLSTGISLFIFNYFNFRKKAVCFAGDVGSVSLAFIIVFILLELIISSQNLIFLGLILLYGLDTVTTIVFRLIRRENVFEAHRSHFYQYLVNERQWPHLVVSSAYSLVQLIINAIIITQFGYFDDLYSSGNGLFTLVAVSGIAFLVIRVLVEGKEHLIGKKDLF